MSQMKKSNWPNNFDLSHPNWTGRTPSQYDGQLRTKEKEPSVLVQVVLMVLAVVAFMAGMFAL